jgi:hypothetical protein
MDRRATVGGGLGGGERIPAPRPTTSWLIQAIAAVSLSGGLAAWASIGAGQATGALTGLGAASTLTVALSMIVGSPRLLAGGVAGLAGVCALAVAVRPTAAAIAFGVGLYVAAELAFAAVEVGPSGLTVRPAEAQRWQLVGVVVAVSATVDGLAMLVTHGPTGGGLGLESLGAVAVAGIVGLVLLLARHVQR